MKKQKSLFYRIIRAAMRRMKNLACNIRYALTEIDLSTEAEIDSRAMNVLEKAHRGGYAELDSDEYGWSWSNARNDCRLAPYISDDRYLYYSNKALQTGDKAIYLTFDNGFGEDNIGQILNILVKNKVEAAFFVTGRFVKTYPRLVRRMKREGHAVGNHTLSHKDLPTISDEDFCEEIMQWEKIYVRLIGKDRNILFRAPFGNHSQKTLAMSEDLGYYNFFWSIAYVDYRDEQPTKDYVINHIKEHLHNGAILLMHPSSSANMEALQDVINMIRNEGYRFGSLYEMTH